jgi:hypothetical protein
MIIRRELLAAALSAVSPSDTRYALGSIQIEPSGRVSATDGHVLITAKQYAPSPDADFPNVTGAPYHGDPSDPVLLPSDLAARLIKATPKKSTIPILQCVQVARNGSDHTATITATDLQIPTIANVQTTKHPEGRAFPAIDQVLKQSSDATFITVALAVDVLETMIKAAKAISGGKATPSIQFQIPTHNASLTEGKSVAGKTVCGSIPFTVHGVDEIQVSGVAMPVRV